MTWTERQDTWTFGPHTATGAQWQAFACRRSTSCCCWGRGSAGSGPTGSVPPARGSLLRPCHSHQPVLHWSTAQGWRSRRAGNQHRSRCGKQLWACRALQGRYCPRVNVYLVCCMVYFSILAGVPLAAASIGRWRWMRTPHPLLVVLYLLRRWRPLQSVAVEREGRGTEQVVGPGGGRCRERPFEQVGGGREGSGWWVVGAVMGVMGGEKGMRQRVC